MNWDGGEWNVEEGWQERESPEENIQWREKWKGEGGRRS
jgi:hypothetical protein